MHEGLFLVDTSGRIVMANQALCRMLGRTEEEILGRPCSIMDCDACDRIRKEGTDHWCRLFADSAIQGRRCRVIDARGNVLSVLKNACVLRQDGEIVGAVETLVDISPLEDSSRALAQLKSEVQRQDGDFMGMVGRGQAMQRTFEMLTRAAGSQAPVIITGESGTGKELAARAVHELSLRAGGPYVQFSCAALNESLLESELFGHAKGAFTGAHRHRRGRFEAADTGSIFLDEIGEVGPSIQVKLLRVLESMRFSRVGEHREIAADVRLITATNQDLGQMVTRGAFRKDLFFRINVIPVHLPPLRERGQDIALLADHFVLRLAARTGRKVTGIAPGALARLEAHHWPGNVRELKSAMEYAMVMAGEGVIEPGHLPRHIADPGRNGAHTVQRPGAERSRGARAARTDQAAEAAELVDALKQAGGNKSQAARILGVARGTVINRMRKHGVEVEKTVT
jgi:PAS domain S-box-containing protein